MKNPLRSYVARARSAAADTRALTGPVQAFIAAELAAVVVLAGIASIRLWETATAFDPAATPPPWRALLVAPLAGAAVHVARLARPLVAVRRWHGVLVRRLDERLAHDHSDASDETGAAVEQQGDGR